MSILDGVKAYLRVDGNQENEVIRTLIDTAKTFILQGTGVEVKETDAQSVLCMHMIVGFWFIIRESSRTRSITVRNLPEPTERKGSLFREYTSISLSRKN